MVEGIAAVYILPGTDFFKELSNEGFSSHVFCPQRPEKVVDDAVLHRGRFMTPRSPQRTRKHIVELSVPSTLVSDFFVDATQCAS